MTEQTSKYEYPLSGEPGFILKKEPCKQASEADTARIELKHFRAIPKVIIKSAQDIVDLVSEMADYDKERIKIIHLDNQNRVLNIENISEGTLDSATVHPREVLKGLLLSNAAGAIVIHNHPSGSSNPSEEDLMVHKLLSTNFYTFRITYIDNIIIGENTWYSIIHNKKGEVKRHEHLKE